MNVSREEATLCPWGTVGTAQPSGKPSSPGDASVVQALLPTHDDVEPAAQVIGLHVHDLGRQSVWPACPFRSTADGAEA